MATTPYTETSADTLSGSVNGTNTDFVVSHTPDDGSVLGFVNGFFIPSTVSGTTVTFTSAPLTGDTVSVFYTVTSAVSASSGAVTGLTIIQNALLYLNKLGVGQSITEADQTLGLKQLNLLIDRWRVKRSYVIYFNHASYSFDTSQQSYTIGQDSADFEADRPIKIIRANLIRTGDDPNTHIPLLVYEMDEYASLSVPATSGQEPDRIYYQPTFPNGTLWPWPYPENDADILANELELFTWSYMTSWATTDTSVDLAPGYEDALTLSLAERLTVPYGVAMNPELKDQARQARASIARINTIPKKIATRDYGIPMSEGYA